MRIYFNLVVILAFAASIAVYGKERLNYQGKLAHGNNPVSGTVPMTFQIFDGLQVVGGGLMRGMGRPKAGAIVNLIGFYVIGLPLGWLLGFPMELGIMGIWWGLVAGLGGVALMLCVWVMRTAKRPLVELTVDTR